MADTTNAPVIDIDGTEAVSAALLTLLNQFPGVTTGKKVEFSTLSDDGGIGFFPTSGAVLLTDKEDITGHVSQVCLYPFNVVYRAAPKNEAQRLRIVEFLDTLGKWLEMQPVIVSGTTHQLTAYPSLASGKREIKAIKRTSPAHLNQAYQDGVEDWTIAVQLQYDNEFDK